MMGCVEKIQRLKRLLHILKPSIILPLGMALSEFRSQMSYFPHYLFQLERVLFYYLLKVFVVWVFLLLSQSHYSGKAIKSIPRFWEHHVTLSKEQGTGG